MSALGVLLTLITLAAITQPTAQRFFAAMSFALISVGHDQILGNLDGFAYYGSAALANLIVLSIIAGVRPIPRTVLLLQLLCVGAMVLNLIGWVMWTLFLPPDVYNIAFIFFYGVTLIAMLDKDSYDVGGFTADGWRDCFRYADHPGYLRLQTYARSVWASGNK